MLPLGNWMVQCPMALTSLLHSLIYQYCTSLCFLPPLHLFLLSILSKCYTLLLTSASRRDGGEVQVKSRNLRQFWGTSDAVLSVFVSSPHVSKRNMSSNMNPGSLLALLCLKCWKKYPAVFPRSRGFFFFFLLSFSDSRGFFVTLP